MATRRYYYGNAISEYGLENNRVDYACFAKAFDAVLANNLMQDTDGIGWWEQVSGFVDNSDEIEELNEKLDEAKERLADLDQLYELDPDNAANEMEYDELEEDISRYESEIEELEYEQDDFPEVYQWYIVGEYGAKLIEREINGVVFYNEALDLYLWGVCHFGTAWDYVLTGIKIDDDKD